MTLSTEAGATTEYRVGSGAFLPYTAPITLDDDGTHTVEYRSRDAAGNQEAAKSFSVKVDLTGPRPRRRSTRPRRERAGPTTGR